MTDPTLFFKNKSVLITGGTGSFGKMCVKKLLSLNVCRRIIVLSRDEWKQWEMQESSDVFKHPSLRYFLGDVRDTERLKRAFSGVDYIIHAAALKQVPAAEYNPTEFIKTNIDGASNVINAAIDAQVKGVIALSTDKAVNPTNLYGATKLCSDKLFVAGNSYVGLQGYPFFSVVRYGNVIGSRGSVISQWQKMIDEGASMINITDERMTRFWISIEQAVDFVIKCFPIAIGGEIFVPKIPSMKITDLARALTPDLPFNIIGIRPGEKLHESMISIDDGRHTAAGDKFYIIIPEITHSERQREFFKKQLRVSSGFSYSSDNNDQWLSSDQLKAFL